MKITKNQKWYFVLGMILTVLSPFVAVFAPKLLSPILCSEISHPGDYTTRSFYPCGGIDLFIGGITLAVFALAGLVLIYLAVAPTGRSKRK